MTEKYRLECKNGCAVVWGPIPIKDLVAKERCWSMSGLDLADVLISKKIGAAMVVGSRESLSAWRAELGLPDIELVVEEIVETSGDELGRGPQELLRTLAEWSERMTAAAVQLLNRGSDRDRIAVRGLVDEWMERFEEGCSELIRRKRA